MRQIRSGVFETNSSSVHSLTMCSEEEYKKWENGEVMYWRDADKFAKREQIIEELKISKWYDHVNWENKDEVDDVFSDEGIQTSEDFFDNEYYETFEESYVTPNGEKVIAFGYYGYG